MVSDGILQRQQLRVGEVQDDRSDLHGVESLSTPIVSHLLWNWSSALCQKISGTLHPHEAAVGTVDYRNKRRREQEAR